MSSQESPGTAGNTPQRDSAARATPASTAPQAAAPERRRVTVRRAPKYVPFLVLGGLLGVAAAAVIAYGLPGSESYDASTVFGFFMVLCGGGGVLLGAVVALVLDRLSVRRAERAVVESVPDTETDTGTGTGPDGAPEQGPEHNGRTGTQDRG
ncbi:MAG: hypothetical protein JWO49_749 [Arthrobacter sp.]|nr:hypothetical protein [Arthrobacter sp.]MCU1549096.1 hypothetical protein [Arthrobacter sp.]